MFHVKHSQAPRRENFGPGAESRVDRPTNRGSTGQDRELHVRCETQERASAGFASGKYGLADDWTLLLVECENYTFHVKRKD